MKAILSQLWNDPAKFTAVCRGGLATIGGLLASGKLPHQVYDLIPWWVGLIVMSLSQGVSAGDKNEKSAA